jgi:penicillin-binding protein 2
VIRVPTVYDEAGGNRYVCWKPAGHGTIEVEEALAQSCDIFFYNVGAPGQIAEGSTVPLHYYNPGDSTPHYFSGLGIEKIKQYLEHDYGFGAITGIELAGEAEGLVPDAKWLFQSSLHGIWSIGDTINVSIGQGYLACTPLQLLCGTAALANGGNFYRPRLVKALKDEQGNVVKEFPADPLRKLSIESTYINTTRRGMRQVVTYGTAKGKFIKAPSNIAIAGKTGTAEFGEAVDGKYKKQHAWFTAFAPYDQPTIAVVVLIQGGGEGATYAVPVADEILAAFFK